MITKVIQKQLLNKRQKHLSMLAAFNKKYITNSEKIYRNQKLVDYVNIKTWKRLIRNKLVPLKKPIRVPKFFIPSIEITTYQNNAKIDRVNILNNTYKLQIISKHFAFINKAFQIIILYKNAKSRTHTINLQYKNKLIYTKSSKENKNFFRYADAVYTSYWFGRLTNMFIMRGGKKKVIRQMHNIMLLLKYKYQNIPLLILYELLEKLKPVFLLRKYKIRRTQLVEYPYVAKNSRRYMKALQWIRKEIDLEKKYKQSSEILSITVFNKFVAIKENFNKHSLLKTRDIHNIYSNMSQFNIRYNWKRNTRW